MTKSKVRKVLFIFQYQPEFLLFEIKKFEKFSWPNFNFFFTELNSLDD